MREASGFGKMGGRCHLAQRMPLVFGGTFRNRACKRPPALLQARGAKGAHRRPGRQGAP